LERKLQDAEIELKSLDDSNRQGQLSLTRQSSLNHTDDDSSNLEQTLSNNKKNSFNHNNDDDDEGLSDTDSDVIQMKQTLKELQQSQFEHKSFFPTSTISMNTIHGKEHSKNTTTSSHNNISPVIQNSSFERTSNQSLIDSGRWSNTMLSTIGNNTYPLSMQQTSSLSKHNYWQSQPSLITREAVLKAARDVLPPGVIDRLSSTTHSKN
jgi:hypothetical protein